jgi:uncharacterized membrane protein
MPLYDLLLLIHILAALTWVGGSVMLTVLGARVVRSGDPGRIVAFTKDSEWVGPRIIAPSALALLGVGIGMVIENPAWEFSQLWIILALIGFAITFIGGLTFFGPESKRIARLIETEGAESPEAQRRGRRILLVSRLDTLLLVLLVVDMVLKPGL